MTKCWKILTIVSRGRASNDGGNDNNIVTASTTFTTTADNTTITNNNNKCEQVACNKDTRKSHKILKMRKILCSVGAEVYQISHRLMNVNCEFLAKPTKWAIHCVENFMPAKCQHKFTDDNIRTIYSCPWFFNTLFLSLSLVFYLPSDLTVNYVFLFSIHSSFAFRGIDTIILHQNSWPNHFQKQSNNFLRRAKSVDTITFRMFSPFLALSFPSLWPNVNNNNWN